MNGITSGVSQMMLQYFDKSNAVTAKTIGRIASGQRISSAADDPAGLAVGMRMNTQITGISTASRNTQDAVSMVRTADGALGDVGTITARMNELAVSAGNGTLGKEERRSIQEEFGQLSAELDRIGQSTNFNGKKLFDGSSYTMQVGADRGDALEIRMGEVSASALGLDKVDLSTPDGAGKALDVIKKASGQISEQRGRMGAFENRLQSTFNNLTNQEYNMTDSMSKIMDADLAKEIMNLGKSTVLSQVSTTLMQNASNMMQYNVQQLMG